MYVDDVPATVVDAIKAGDLTLTQSLFDTIPTEQLTKVACLAAKYAQPTILEWCFTRGFTLKPESCNDEFYTYACTGHSIPIFALLLKHGFNLNTHENEAYGDAIVSAAMKGDAEWMKWLLEHGMKINPGRGCDEEPAIAWAITGPCANIEIVKLLRKHGLPKTGTGALIAAAEVENMEALKFLVDDGADLEEKFEWWGWRPNDGTNETGSALYRACRAGKEKSVEFLLGKGADPRARDVGGRSCYEIAKARGYSEILKMLEERGVKE